jgi:hypothetical protein
MDVDMAALILLCATTYGPAWPPWGRQRPGHSIRCAGTPPTCPGRDNTIALLLRMHCDGHDPVLPTVPDCANDQHDRTHTSRRKKELSLL